MSDDWIKRKKRCIVKRLDFEDCVITNIKTNAKGQRRLRAKTSREIEEKCEIPEDETKEKSFFCDKKGSPILSQRFSTTRAAQTKSSPVLVRKPPKDITGSPVFRSRRKKRRLVSNPPQIVETESSPVFHFKNSPDLFASLEGEQKAEDEDEEETTSQYNIQETSQESADVWIDTFSSHLSEKKTSSELKISVEKSKESTSTCDKNVEEEHKTPEKSEQHGEVNANVLESGKKRKRFKKNSLSARLEKLLKRQISERRIWEHEKKVMKTEGKNEETVWVVSLWKDSTRFFLKCRRLPETLEQQDDNGHVFLVVDSTVVPEVRKAKQGSFIRISPPWQSLQLENHQAEVLLSVICLEVIPEKKEIPESKLSYVPLPKDDVSLVNALFSLDF